MLAAARLLPKYAVAVPPPVAGYYGWYDASDVASITNAGGGAVSQLNDKSGNGNHVVQGTGSARPTTGTRTQNGLNVLDFDGGDALRVTYSGRTADRTVFIVCKHDTVAAGNAVMVSTNSAMYRSTAQWAVYTSGGSTFGTADTNAHVLVFKLLTSGNECCWVDGISVFNSDTGTPPASTNLVIGADSGGASNFTDGWIGEVIVYESDLSDGDREFVEAYLATKWGTP